MSGGIIINSPEGERKFTEFHQRRGELRDALRFGVYPNLVKTLGLYGQFLADFGPGGALYDEQLWTYYLSNIAAIANDQADMIAAAQGIVTTMQAIEIAAPGTFGIELPVTEAVN